MSLRIATTVEHGQLTLMKVRRCDLCPNVLERFHSVTTHSPGQREGLFCELREEVLPDPWSSEVQEGCPLPSLLDISRRRSVDLSLDGKPLALLERYYLTQGDFGFDVVSGTESTLLHFTHRVKGDVSGGNPPDEVLIWIPTASLEEVRSALSQGGSA